MKIKSILKYYFTAEQTQRLLDGLILHRAVSGGAFTAEKCAARVIEVIEKKRALCLLWRHLDGAMECFTKEERLALENYAFSQGSVKDYKAVHKLAVRFTRRARQGISKVRAGLQVVNEYLAC